MSELQPWQTRVITEKEELDARISRLAAALSNHELVIDLVQRDLMIRQLSYMNAYSATLRERIEAWSEKHGV